MRPVPLVSGVTKPDASIVARFAGSTANAAKRVTSNGCLAGVVAVSCNCHRASLPINLIESPVGFERQLFSFDSSPALRATGSTTGWLNQPQPFLRRREVDRSDECNEACESERVLQQRLHGFTFDIGGGMIAGTRGTAALRSVQQSNQFSDWGVIRPSTAAGQLDRSKL